MAVTFSGSQADILADLKRSNEVILQSLMRQVKDGEYVGDDLLCHVIWVDAVMNMLIP